MNHSRPNILKQFGGPGRCEACGLRCRKRAACHIYSKGAGRVDARFNLVSLGFDAVLDCPCHCENHAGGPCSREVLLKIAAKREGTTPAAITEAVHYIRALDKNGAPIRPMKISAEGMRLVQVALSAPTVQRPKRWPNRPIPSRPVRWLKVMNRGMS